MSLYFTTYQTRKTRQKIAFRKAITRLDKSIPLLNISGLRWQTFHFEFEVLSVKSSTREFLVDECLINTDTVWNEIESAFKIAFEKALLKDAAKFPIQSSKNKVQAFLDGDVFIDVSNLTLNNFIELFPNPIHHLIEAIDAQMSEDDDEWEDSSFTTGLDI